VSVFGVLQCERSSPNDRPSVRVDTLGCVATADFDYPSQTSGLRVPNGPTLLDTSVIWNLMAIGEHSDDGRLSADGERHLLVRLGEKHTDELVALDLLTAAYERNGSPWVVSETSLIEVEKRDGARGRKLRQWWHEWADYFQGCLDADWYPEVDADDLIVRRGPEVAEGQFALAVAPPLPRLSAECVPAFGPFRDAGDRALIRDALRAGIPTILTTDIRSFWANRRALYPFGIEVWRPTDLWRTVAHDRAVEVARWRAMLPQST
jgi:hypothetical protein